MSATLIDSYSETNTDAVVSLFSGSITGLSQSFSSSGGLNLYSVKGYFSKVGSPTGNLSVRIYNITGVSGSTAVPTGSPLATATLNVSTLSGSSQLIETLFAPPNTIALGASAYAVAFEYSGGDVSNYVNVGMDNSSPTHSGDCGFTFGSGWNVNVGSDMPFYVYGVPPSTTRTQTGVARITAITLRAQTGKARVTAAATKTQAGKARITIVTTKTQAGKASVVNTGTRTQTGKAKILLQRTKTQAGKAKIIVPSTDTFTKPALAKVEVDAVAVRLARESPGASGVLSNL